MKYRIVRLNNGRYVVQINWSFNDEVRWVNDREFKWLWQARRRVKLLNKERIKQMSEEEGDKINLVVEEIG